MSRLAPINFKKWIEENRALLKPPVGNKLVWEDREFIIMVVGGPNKRTDYHVNQGEEFFYQVEGDITLKVMDDGKPVDMGVFDFDVKGLLKMKSVANAATFAVTIEPKGGSVNPTLEAMQVAGNVG